MKWAVIFEPCLNLYRKEMQIILGEYDYEGIYHDLVRWGRHFYNKYLHYLVALSGVLRIALFVHYLTTKDDAFFRYEISTKLIYNHGNQFYDPYIVSCAIPFLLFIIYLHYFTFERQLSGILSTVWPAVDESNQDLVASNPDLQSFLWNWNHFFSRPLFTCFNFVLRFKQLWFYQKHSLRALPCLKYRMKFFTFVTPRIRIRIWLLSAVFNEVCFTIFTGVIGLIYFGLLIHFILINPMEYSWTQRLVLIADASIPCYTIYHWIRTGYLVAWFVLLIVCTVIMIAKELNDRLVRLYRSRPVQSYLVVVLVHFYQEYRALLKIILNFDKLGASRLLFLYYLVLLPVNVLCFNAFLFKSEANLIHRGITGLLGGLQLFVFYLVLIPIGLGCKRMHQSRNVLVPLQARLKGKFVQIKFNHNVLYELINCKPSATFTLSVGSLFKINNLKILEFFFIYIYCYLYALQHVYSKN